MKQVLLILTALLMGTFSYAQKVEYTPADSALVVKLLKDAKANRGEDNPMLYFGTRFIGVPYVAHTLEKGDSEHLIVNLHEMDCTTFVETVVALSMCDADDARTFKDYCNRLTQVRYRNGQMTDYTSRLHYFTWWAEDNEKKGIVEEVMPSSAGKGEDGYGVWSAVQTININYMTQHPNSYKQLKNHPEFVPVIKQYENETKGKKYRYVPKGSVGQSSRSSLGNIYSGDIIAMLTSKAGLDTSHIGIAVWQGGKIHLLNASSLHKKVVLENKTFYDYQQSQSSQTGIRAFRLKYKQ